MDVARAQSLVDQLEDNIDDLEESLQPILSQALSESTKKLPLLDKAKLHIVIVYAIESLLFCALFTRTGLHVLTVVCSLP